MTTIRASDLTDSIADALQYISYYHPMDHVRALAAAYELEEAPAAKDALAQILVNSRMCAEGHRPVCQDTGIVTVFVEWGQACTLEGEASLQEAIDEGVRRAYLHPGNRLRASIVSDPVFSRKNTNDNTPSVVHVEMVRGGRVEVTVAAKGAGSENKSRLAMLNPSDSVIDWILETVPQMGAGWCPPGILGIGVGGTPEFAMKLAKKALLEPIDISELKSRGAANDLEALRIEIYDRVNSLGIGAQGLGGLTTVLDVKIASWPTHAASKPVAMIPNCAANRHARFVLDGSGPAYLETPKLSEWPHVQWAPSKEATAVDLDNLGRGEVANWRAGDRLLLSGRLLTARDAAHKRIEEMLSKGESLPVSFQGRTLYYVGPVDPVRSEIVGPAGPTTATRMDKFTEMMLGQAGIVAMIGKAERGPAAVEAIANHGAAYLIAVGGAAYLIARSIKKAEVVAFEDLGPEAVYEFEVEDMPVTVAADARGRSLHISGPSIWQAQIAKRRETASGSS